ncbi:MAG: hypothetical protein ACHP65_10540, partial [Legionellales bacterium]
IMAMPPAAVIDAAVIEPDLLRRNYLDLKVKQYNLPTEIDALNLLICNYLSETKEFNSDNITNSKTIKIHSNFLTLLNRFKSELSERQILATVLLNNEISPVQAAALKEDIEQLIQIKTEQQQTLHNDIDKAAALIQENRIEISLLQQQIHELNNNIYQDTGLLPSLKDIFSSLNDTTDENPHELTEQEVISFTRFANAFDEADEVVADLIKEIINKKTINYSDTQKIQVCFKEYQDNTQQEITVASTQLANKQCELSDLLRSKKANHVSVIESQFKKLAKQPIRDGRSKQPPKKKPFNPPAQFAFHDAESTLIHRNLGQIEDLTLIQEELSDCRDKLLKQKQDNLSYLLQLKIAPSLSVEELAHNRIKRGVSNDAHLTGFDVPLMLKEASNLFDSATFHLGNENCSTTTMKLLHAGASESNKSMFEWHQSIDGAPATNVIQTNPQAVFSAAKVVELAEAGDVKALAIKKQIQNRTPDASYNAFINGLTAIMIGTNDVNVQMPSEPTFYLKGIQHLLKIYRDIFHIITLDEKKTEPGLQSKVAEAIQSLDTSGYNLIDSSHASLAVHRMLQGLQNNPTYVGFYENDTVSRVERY